MNSFDTNILLYGTNQDCAEFESANRVINQALQSPEEWIIADQVYFELYRLLGNKTVLEKPATPSKAFSIVSFFRNSSGWLHCCYETSFWNEVEKWLSAEAFSARNVFDLKLAVTLKKNSITTFYTRNVKDFKYLDYFRVINPI